MTKAESCVSTEHRSMPDIALSRAAPRFLLLPLVTVPKGLRVLHLLFPEGHLTHFGGMVLLQRFCSKLRLRWLIQNYVKIPQRNASRSTCRNSGTDPCVQWTPVPVRELFRSSNFVSPRFRSRWPVLGSAFVAIKDRRVPRFCWLRLRYCGKGIPSHQIASTGMSIQGARKRMGGRRFPIQTA